MKKLFTLLFVSASLTAAAQDDLSGMEKRGNTLYSNFDYPEAARTLEAVEPKSAEVYRKLGKSYDLLGDYDLAEKNFALAVASPNHIPQDLIDYARALMKNQKYEQAEMVLKDYAAVRPDDVDAKRYELLSETLAKSQRTGSNFTVSPMNMNNEAQDFAPVMYDGKLLFTSSRSNKPGFVHRRWNANKKPFLDIYQSNTDGSGIEKADLLAEERTNKKYHDGPVAFSMDGKEMYITRNETDARSSNGVRNFTLLVSQRTGSGWSEPVQLPFCSREFSSGHAALSPDGNVLVFASDMPGGKGGADLYKCTRNGAGWSSPVNLAEINTAADEVFPFFQSEGVLFFSSDGLPGYGGLDLFAAQWKEGNVKRFLNLGSPVNSSHDDFSPWLDAGMTKGYFASNRTGARGSDDLYSFTMAKPIKFSRTVKGSVRDKQGTALAGAKVFFRDAAGNVLGETISDNAGNYAFDAENTGNYVLVGQKSKYFEGSQKTAITDETPDEVLADIVLEKDPGFALLAKVTDKSDNSPLSDVQITLVNNLTGQQEVVKTNEKGEIFVPVRDRKLNERISYNLKMEKEGYLGKTVTYNKALNREGVYQVDDDMNLGLQKMGVGVDLAKAIDLKPIYFDLGKAVIRPDAATELDKIVKIMNENPAMVVELGAHTDCRGTAKKNKELSQKRAVASATYIQKRISNPSRISGIGYGETKILNGCECEGKVKPACTEDEHAINRRTEFIVIKM